MQPTDNQSKNIKKSLSTYKRKYLRKEFSKLDESATRLMVNSLLTDILGYKELEEIKTEYRIRSEYADYVIQVNRKKHFVVEVKSIELDINERHLRQSISYAANEGIEWIMLTNGREIKLYKLKFTKPIKTDLVFSIDMQDDKDYKKAPNLLWILTKKSVERGFLDDFWKRTSALSEKNIAKYVLSEEIIRRIRNDIKNDTGIYFQIEDIANALKELIANANTELKMVVRPKK